MWDHLGKHLTRHDDPKKRRLYEADPALRRRRRVERPPANDNEEQHARRWGDAQARKLLEAPPDDTLKGVRDRAILATLLYQRMRREEFCGFRGNAGVDRPGVTL